MQKKIASSNFELIAPNYTLVYRDQRVKKPEEKLNNFDKIMFKVAYPLMAASQLGADVT